MRPQIEYPQIKKHKKPLSKIRYKYQNEKLDANAKKLNRKIVQAILGDVKSGTVLAARSDMVVTSFDYFVNIMRIWDDKSKEINGWKSCFFTIHNAREMLKAIKTKYSANPQTIEFRNISEIYYILGLKDKGYTALNKVFHAIWIATSKHGDINSFIDLRTIIEGIAKSQVMYHVANYKSRGSRTYQLPFEQADDPVHEYRKIYTARTMQAMQKKKVDHQIKFKQPGIRQFFKPMKASNGDKNKKSNADEEKNDDCSQEILDDDWVLATLEELDNGSQYDFQSQ